MVVSGLRARLLRVAARRPHVLLVAAPGRERLRWAAEAWLAAAGWPEAPSPADTDVVVLLGEASDELREVVDRVAAGVPAPLVRAQVRRVADLADVLPAAQRRLAVGGDRPDRVGLPEEPGMADRGDDRDGLRLDVLHLPLGPVLPAWPAGLVVRVVLQGDVVQEATPELLPAAAPEGEETAAQETATQETAAEAIAAEEASVAPPRLVAARDLDLAADVLRLAGTAALAERAARLRDGLVVATPAADLPRAVDALARRVGGARLLRGQLRGTPTVDGGDVLAALDERLASAGAAAHVGRGQGGREQGGRAQEDWPRRADGSDDGSGYWDADAVRHRLHALPAALRGAELAQARLAVAAAGLRDVAALVPTGAAAEPVGG